MASPTRWTWVWVSSGSWWLTGRPGVLQSMGWQSQTRLSDWTELIDLLLSEIKVSITCLLPFPASHYNQYLLISCYVYIIIIYCEDKKPSLYLFFFLEVIMLACLFEFFFPLALFPIYMSFSFFNVWIENLLFSFSMCFLFLSGKKRNLKDSCHLLPN